MTNSSKNSKQETATKKPIPVRIKYPLSHLEKKEAKKRCHPAGVQV